MDEAILCERIRTNKWDSVNDGVNSARNRECGVLAAEVDRGEDSRGGWGREEAADGWLGVAAVRSGRQARVRGRGRQGGEGGISRVLGFIPLGRRHRHRWMLRVAGPRAWGVSSARDLLPEGVNLLAICSNVFSKSDHARSHARIPDSPRFSLFSPPLSRSLFLLRFPSRVRRSCETDRSVKSSKERSFS